MATVTLNSALKGLRGQVGEWVYKQYTYGTVVTRVPRMKGIKPSAAQRTHRDRVRAAAKFYRDVRADPVLLKRYSAMARKRGIPLPAVTLAEYFRAGAAFYEEVARRPAVYRDMASVRRIPRAGTAKTSVSLRTSGGR